MIKLSIASTSKDGITNKTISINDIWNVKEFCRITYFRDKNSRAIDPDFKNNILTGEIIYLNAEIDNDRLGTSRYTRVTIISEDDERQGRAISCN